MPSLIATLGLSASQFYSGLNSAANKAASVGKEIGSSLGESVKGMIGGITAGAILDKLMESAERIQTLSNEFRVSTDEIQIWDKAGKKVGLTAEDIGNAFNKLKKAREEAVESGKIGGFGAFGINMADLRNAGIATRDIMDAIRASSSGHRITDEEDVAGMELMGKSGAKILSAMQQLSQLGPVKLINKEDVEALHEARKNLESTKRDLMVSASRGVSLAGFQFKFLGGMLSAAQMAIFQKRSIKDALQFGFSGVFGKEEEPKEKAGGIYRKSAIVDLNKDAAEIDKERAALAEKILKNKMAEMTVDQRRSAIIRELRDNERKIIEYRYGEGDELKAVQMENKSAELYSQLIGLKASNASPISVNELQRIGAYASAPGDTALLDSTRRSENHLQRISAGIDRLNSKSSGGSGVTYA